MTGLWFVDVPVAPQAMTGGDSTVLYAQSQGRGWAVATQPILDDDLPSWAGGLLGEMAYVLASAGVAMPARLEVRDVPAAVWGNAGQPAVVQVAGQRLFANRWHLDGDYTAMVTVVGDDLVAALAPEPSDLALAPIQDPVA